MPDTDTNHSSSVNQQSGTESEQEIKNELVEAFEEYGLEPDPSDSNIDQRTPEFVWEKYRQRWLADNKAPSSLQPYESAWKQFAEWMGENDYEFLSELNSRCAAKHDNWIITHNEYDKNRLSRAEHLGRIKRVIGFAESQGWINAESTPDNWEKIKPDLKDSETIRSNPLDPERGEKILQWVRQNRPFSRSDVLWTLVFKYGFRVSAIRALDCEDLILTEPEDWSGPHEFRPHFRLKDRPQLGEPTDKGLPLKNTRSELAGRRVPIQQDDIETFRRYVRYGSPHGAKESRKTYDQPDKFGLKPLITGEHNPRLSEETVQDRIKWLTCPTTYSDECNCGGCKAYRTENGGDNPPPSHIGKHCERSRSPHQVRHGAITWLLDSYDHSVVSQIVGTSEDTIRDVYDRADDIRRMERVASEWT